MSILKIFGIIAASLISLVLLGLGLIKLLALRADKNAERKGREYCNQHGYTFKKVEAYPNHYGLFLIADNMHIYASFHYEKDGSLSWLKKSPENKIEKRLKKK